ncbi:hypothetical protein DSO57_1039167 [Entomophthora muscae]|uniref:Uncharacterized protein n=1 Tax=Entomophthora muscae TaxID=34485 RepID=A0ACC2RD68_9FUNG|nr:hypothetical protein DSO57_1039167 [Entomophthora muscae]
MTVQNSIIPWSKAAKQGMNSLISHQVIQTFCCQGLDSNWISIVAAHIKENELVIWELVHEGPSQPVISTPSPLSAMMNRDILELYDHLLKLQHEVKESFYKVKHKIDGFQDEKATLSNWCQGQDKNNAEQISKLQEALTNQEKRRGLLEEKLDVNCLETWAYTDELDEHNALMASIQDQLERENRKMASLEQRLDSLTNQHQHRKTGRQSQGRTRTHLGKKSICGAPVHQSPNCVLDHSQGLAGRGCHSLGSKWAFIHSQKEDPLRNFMVYGPGGQGNNMGFPILGVLQQYLGLFVLCFGLLYLSLGLLLLQLGLLLGA